MDAVAHFPGHDVEALTRQEKGDDRHSGSEGADGDASDGAGTECALAAAGGLLGDRRQRRVLDQRLPQHGPQLHHSQRTSVFSFFKAFFKYNLL